MKLGVNIDHIATLREARKEGIPDVIKAAEECLAGGADGIVCHLREDRRHIQDKDVIELRKISPRLDLEMAATDEMVKFALKIKPDYVTLVPEKRQELTTEGGLDVVKHSKKLKPIIKKLQDKGIAVSLFVDPVLKQIEESAVLVSKYIEIHTGKYSNAKNEIQRKKELEKLEMVTEKAFWIGLKVNAGHGLNYTNVKDILVINGIEELNIGFSIISRAVFVGLKQAVKEMKACLPVGKEAIK